MAGEIIDRPNPQALASHIPDEVLNLSVKLQKMSISDEDLRGLREVPQSEQLHCSW
jgi:xylulose-5-phosphate/fructose-6-phosphate phosphoketolase